MFKGPFDYIIDFKKRKPNSVHPLIISHGIKFEILKITNDNLVSSKLLIIEKEARSSTL